MMAERKIVLDESALDAAASKIWYSESHPLMEKMGHSTEWQTLNKAVKRGVVRQARLAIQEYLSNVNGGEL